MFGNKCLDPKFKMRELQIRSPKRQASQELIVEDDGEEGLIGASPGPSDSSSDSDIDVQSDQDKADEAESDDENEEKWTLRVCLILAVDLPFNVVPNVPLCPILKFGLVRTPER